MLVILRGFKNLPWFVSTYDVFCLHTFIMNVIEIWNTFSFFSSVISVLRTEGNELLHCVVWCVTCHRCSLISGLGQGSGSPHRKTEIFWYPCPEETCWSLNYCDIKMYKTLKIFTSRSYSLFMNHIVNIWTEEKSKTRTDNENINFLNRMIWCS